jgi:hypothetical protein
MSARPWAWGRRNNQPLKKMPVRIATAGITRKEDGKCMMFFFLTLSLAIQPQPARAAGEKFVEEFKAVVSKDTIKVGENTVVTFKGKQLDLAGGNSIESFGTEFASIVKLTQVDKTKFKVTGLAPGETVLKFKNGDKETEVKITVVVGN